MENLRELIWTEKYRPQNFEDLILEDKSLILNYLKSGKSIPSFLFYSNAPGTGKTSCAKIICKTLGADILEINSSDERGIDTIRDKIKLFAQSLSTNEFQRCIFMDEFDGCTRQAQDSLRNLMETYSDNCFFIFSCNDVSKIIEPIRSRCVSVNFERPPKADILAKLSRIVSLEKVDCQEDDLEYLLDRNYPDIRSMITTLQTVKLEKKNLTTYLQECLDKFEEFYNLIKSKNMDKVYEIVYSGDFEVLKFNSWMFQRIFKDKENQNLRTFSNFEKICYHLADTEKFWNQGANIEVIFLSNVVEMMKYL